MTRFAWADVRYPGLSPLSLYSHSSSKVTPQVLGSVGQRTARRSSGAGESHRQASFSCAHATPSRNSATHPPHGKPSHAAACPCSARVPRPFLAIGPRSFPSSVSLFDLKARIRSNRASLTSTRAEAIKVGRHPDLASCSALPGHTLTASSTTAR